MRMPFKICTVVQGNTLPLFLENLLIAKAATDRVELRADSIKDLQSKDIETLKKNSPAHTIFTYRSVKEGGLFGGSAKEQKLIYEQAFSSGFELIDLSLGNSLLKNLNTDERKRLLVSYHNFEATPSFDKLKAVLKKMREESPAAIKISCMVNGPKDVFVLADILKERKEREKLIVIGMGELGKLTRVMFPSMGSYLTYAAMDEKKLAPGLMTLKDIQSIYNIITKS